MSYHIPSDDEIVNFVHVHNNFVLNPNVNNCFRFIVDALDTSIRVASLNSKNRSGYIYYLKYFLRYIEASANNINSPLRRKLDDYLKLKKLNEIL